MPYVIENIAAGGFIARDIPEMADAVLQAARYDGWGAEYFRNSAGEMGLRCSSRHIGNNPWMASGEEPPAYGHTSQLEDDDAAIEEVATRIASEKWGGNMRNLLVRDQADFIRERLQVILDDYEGDTGPGTWLLDEEGLKEKGRALLCYQWPDGMTEDDPHWGDCDAPWKKWGGEAMVQLIGGRIANGYGIDGIDHAEIELA